MEKVKQKDLILYSGLIILGLYFFVKSFSLKGFFLFSFITILLILSKKKLIELL